MKGKRGKSPHSASLKFFDWNQIGDEPSKIPYINVRSVTLLQSNINSWTFPPPKKKNNIAVVHCKTVVSIVNH